MYEKALEVLEMCFRQLHSEAVAVVSAHWEEILAREKAESDWTQRSVLVLASHRKGNHIQLKWIGTKWYGTKTARRTVKINITRNKGDLSYSTAKLKVWAKDWELPIVLETERKLTLIRKRAFFLTKSIVALRNSQAIVTNSPIAEIESEYPDSNEEGEFQNSELATHSN